jgi:diguanylate cyclase (GGDEF)-like protein
MPFETSAPGLRRERGEPTPLHVLSLLAQVSRAIPDVARRKAVVARAEEIARAAGRVIRTQSARIRMLEHLAVTDPLTGLTNRRGLGQRLSERLSEARRHNEPGVVLFVDMDGLGRINHSLGHAAGDAAIRMVAEGLRNAVRGHDTVGRVGGDAFAVLMSRIGHDKGLAAAARIGRSIGRLTLVQDGRAVPLSVSVGLAPFTGSETEDELLDRADGATDRGTRAALAVE